MVHDANAVTPTDDGPPPLPRMQRHGQLEVDAFCAGCQYNLHGQPVTIDDRLNIPVCRCPECGRFHPAGVGVSASVVWVRRLGTVLLFAWVGVVLATAAAICLLMGVFTVASVEVYSRRVEVTADGRAVNRPTVGNLYVPAGASVPPAGRTLWVEVLHPVAGGPAGGPEFAGQGDDPYYSGGSSDRYRNGPGPTPFVWLSLGSFATGLLAGGLCAVFLWHWPRRRYALCLLVVVPAAAFVGSVFAVHEDYMLVRGQVFGRLAVAAAIQCAGVLVGTQVGRPVARGVARTVIPPKPRQLLAFLWQADGRPPPTAAA